MSDDLVVIGRLSRPHGLRGALRAKPTGPNLAGLPVGAELFVFRTNEPPRSVVLASTAGTVDAPVLTFRGVGDRTAAEGLAGSSLAIERARLVTPPDDDSFYVEALLGCEVTVAGEPRGVVERVDPGPANDVLGVRVPGRDELLLLPFTRDAVPTVDLEHRRLEIREDLLGPEDWA